ncbi:helix-turn-helix transcriptional regulator [Rhodococcus sp. BP-241]|uniref:helix-turn-helix domain-containing protein n=1 Tax=Rhodococcus sp. BP-241 TaxID=2739441 RepID=UPI001C9B996F|nr:XRE family transcriptional regulator [Rhodococcus sp. BP-241]MBY6708612.1 helix-turn-helix transcriptional regulator [Rhodococcus sp. BP-241]
MADDSAQLATAIGARVRHERHALRWTLDRLADTAGVSRRMLVNVEQGSANPSIGTLLKLSDALGVGLPALVEPPVPDPLRVTRQGEGAVLWRGDAGGRAILVVGTSPPNVVELWDWTLGPGDCHRSEAHAPGTRELLHVRSGSCTIEVADRSVHLDAGDALTFRGDVAHAYLNVTETPAAFALTVFEPHVGEHDRTDSRHA